MEIRVLCVVCHVCVCVHLLTAREPNNELHTHFVDQLQSIFVPVSHFKWLSIFISNDSVVPALAADWLFAAGAW